MCHAGQHTVCPIDITILQKPGDQNRLNVAEEFCKKTMRPWRDSGQPLNAKEALSCGLQNSESPASDNRTPQETTIQDTDTVGADRGGLPCPGSSAVANPDDITG